MLERFRLNFTELTRSLGEIPEQPVYLLAVSGGVDSVVMAHLFHQSGFKCAIAHCNFKLRGAASGSDEQFVKQLALHYGFDFHVEHFETKEYAGDNNVSIQMAARHLRYQWFNQLIRKYGYTGVSVAHHADDVAETMLLNLVRGTGIAGMHGISAVNNHVIRPLLFATRKEIENYAGNHQLVWREDASNADDYYLRNKLRLNVFPVLKEMNPSVVQSFVKHAHLMSSYEKLLNSFLATVENAVVINSFGGIVKTMSMVELNRYPEPVILLFHLLNKYGYNAEVCREILAAKQPGSEFRAPGYKLVVGRDELFLLALDELNHDEEFTFHENDVIAELRFGRIEMSKIPGKDLPDDFISKNTACLDASKLSFPLKIRRWKHGDYFHPLGMQGRKLISDYFVDEKFSAVQKELVYLLLSGGDVVWVVGHRIDDRFKLTDNTAFIRKFTWKQLN